MRLLYSNNFKYIILFINILFVKNSLSKETEPIINSFGISISVGYSKEVYSGERTKLKTDTYSYESLLLYNMNIYNKFDVEPFIGFTKAVINASNSFYARLSYNNLTAGSHIAYNIKHIQPLLGIRGQKVLSIVYYDEIDKSGSDVSEYYSSVLFQVEAGINYKVNRVRFGLNAWFGINYLTNTFGYRPYRLNQYYFTFTYYPFKR